MKHTIKNKVFQVEYKKYKNEYSNSILVECDSFKDAVDIFEMYMKDQMIDTYEIINISTYQPIIKPITKTITVEL